MMEKMKNFDSTKLNITLLVSVWVILIAVINPVGEFPFADDFAYAKPVKHLLETGQVRITDWSSMTLVAQIYIGAAVTSVFGFSFTALRCIGLLSGIAGVIGFYFLTLTIGGNRKIAFLSALLIAFHPYYYLLSYSFTTDIPFFAFIIWSIYFYTRTLKENKTKLLVAAVGLNVIALLIRDLGILIPAAFAVAYAVRYKISYRTILKILLPFFFILLTFALWRVWIEYFHGVPKNIDFSRKKMLTVWTSGLGYLMLIYVKNILYSVIYIGIYTAPVIFLLARESFSAMPKKLRIAMFTAIAVILPVFVYLMLTWNKIAADVGDFLATHLVGHNFFWADVHNPSHADSFFFPGWLLLVISAIGLTIGIMLVFLLLYKINAYYKTHNYKILKTNNGVVEFIAIIIIIYLGIIFSQILVNRYLILPMALMIPLITYKLDIRKPVGWLVKSLIAIFLIYNIYNSVAASHDMLSFNRARWSALGYLNNELKIPADKIDGGFEYNAWNFYRYDFPADTTKNWWFVKSDEYVVSWGRIDGYAVIRESSYTRWYPPCFRGKIFISKKLR